MMLKRYQILMLLLGAFTVTGAYAEYAPVLWDSSGVVLRQGHHIHWQEAGDYDPVTGDQVYVWSDCRLGDRDVYAQKIDVNGNLQWGEGGKLIISELGRQDSADVVYAGNGTWIVVWDDFRDDPENRYEGDIYAQKVNSSGYPLWNPAGVPVCVEISLQTNPKPVADGDGGVIIIWTDKRNGYYDIYAQRLTSTGEIAPGWLAQGNPVISYADYQVDFSADTDGQGGAIVVWEDFRPTYGVDIYAQRIRSDGTLAWISSGLPICVADYEQRDPVLCSDNNGGIFIVWKDMRNDHNFGDLYFQRVDSLGDISYAANGRVLCDAIMEQYDCEIIASDDGGAIVAWTDYRNDPQNIYCDIYAQKVDSAGNERWGTNGLPVCITAEIQQDPHLISDGTGGAIIGWQDSRNTGHYDEMDIYAQRISPTGMAHWTANGIMVCDVDDTQRDVLLIRDGNYGAFFVWDDRRSGSTGLYIQHCNGAGVPQMPQNGTPIHIGIDGSIGNPMMVSAGDGTRTLVVWEDYRYDYWSKCMYLQVIDSGCNIYLEENGVSLRDSAAGNRMDMPHFVSDQMGGALLVWEDVRDANAYTQIYAQRIDQNGNMLWAGGGIHVHECDYEQMYPFVAPSGDGGAYVVWSELDDFNMYVYCQKLDAGGDQVWSNPIQVSNGVIEDICCGAVPDGDGGVIMTWQGGIWPDYKVYAQRLDSNGQAQWGSHGMALCPADSGQQQPSLITDGQCGAYVVWEDRADYTDCDVVAQHVNGSGNLMWSDSGLVICDAESDPYSISMELNNVGNVFFLWADFRNSVSMDVYLQLVTPQGEILCEPNGFPVSAGDYDRWYAVMVSDSQDGIYIAWKDYRSGWYGCDIYGLHVNGNCEIVSGWIENGEIINDEIFLQSDPAIVSDGNGGAIVAWEDGRASHYQYIRNLFVQRVNDFTTSVEPEEQDPVAVTFRLEQNYPNPFNPATRIRYSLSNVGRVKLVIYDILGRQVQILQNQVMNAGSHEVIWNGTTASGLMASSGIYLYKLETDDQTEIRKMVLLK